LLKNFRQSCVADPDLYSMLFLPLDPDLGPARMVLHRTRIDKCATKKFIIRQWWNFFDVIHRFPLVKAAMNAPRVCKFRKNCLSVIDQGAMVVKTPPFLRFQ
jgi:hypothetical protein